MSSFSRQHCPTCNDETLHRFSVCLTCKTARVTPSEQRRVAGERIQARRREDEQFDNHVRHAQNRKWFDRSFLSRSRIPTRGSDWERHTSNAEIRAYDANMKIKLGNREAWELATSGQITIAGANKITGKRADCIIIDDPHNEEISVKPTKQPKKTYNTCGVRFIRGHNLAKVYTYRVPKKVKLHLGEEIVVPTVLDGLMSNAIAVVVELHSTPQDNDPCITYKFVAGRIAPIKV